MHPAMSTTTLPTRPQYEPVPADMEELSAQWKAALSDPAPSKGTLYDWLRRYGKPICRNAINATIRKYNHMFRTGAPMTYDHAVRYTASCARNALNAENEFHAPAEWTNNA
jgi:hypothetical protein